MRYTTSFAGCGNVGNVDVVTSPDFHEANRFSSLGVISASVVSPTMSNVALLGLNQVSWNLARSSRVILLTLSSVPVPMKGFVVGMTFAEEKRREERGSPWRRGDFLALDGGEAFFLQALEFFLREGRMEDEVGVNVEGLIHIDLEGVEIDAGIIEIGAGAEIGAEGFQFFADLEGIARGSSLFKHALGEAAVPRASTGSEE